MPIFPTGERSKITDLAPPSILRLPACASAWAFSPDSATSTAPLVTPQPPLLPTASNPAQVPSPTVKIASHQLIVTGVTNRLSALPPLSANLGSRIT